MCYSFRIHVDFTYEICKTRFCAKICGHSFQILYNDQIYFELLNGQMDAGKSFSDLHGDKCNQLKIRTRSSSRLQQNGSNYKIDSNNDSSIDESDKDPKKDVEICMGTLNSSKTLKDYVSKEETDRFPTGWIYKSDRSKFEKMYEGDKSTDHVGKLVLIRPDFWGWFDTKKNIYRILEGRNIS